jgi:hypothetical protein
MEIENYTFNKKQIEKKYNATIKYLDNENIKKKKKDIEIIEKYKYFSNKICEIMLSSNSLLNEYKNSDYLNQIKNSDKIGIEMKKYIIKFEREELKLLINQLDNYKFIDEIQDIINTEIELNINSFLNDYKSSKMSNALKYIGDIKLKFDYIFPNLIFNIIEFEQKINKQIEIIKFKENEKNEIYDIIQKIMIDKFKDIINNNINII